MTVRVPPGVNLTKGVAITSSFQLDAQAHVENVRYGKGSNAMGLLATILQAERAISFWPARGGEDPRPARGGAYERLGAVSPAGGAS